MIASYRLTQMYFEREFRCQPPGSEGEPWLTMTRQAVGLDEPGTAYPNAACIHVYTSQDWRQDTQARSCACGCELNLPVIVRQHPG